MALMLRVLSPHSFTYLYNDDMSVWCCCRASCLYHNLLLFLQSDLLCFVVSLGGAASGAVDATCRSCLRQLPRRRLQAPLGES